jgi:hypothetical protein
MDPQRRAFVVFLGGALATPSLLANAQQATRVRTVGVLMGIADDGETQARAKAIEQGLAKRDGLSVKISTLNIGTLQATLSACLVCRKK